MTTTKSEKAKLQREKAAGLEKTKQWARAASAWFMARRQTQKSGAGHANIDYCQNRAEFCQTMAIYEEDDC